MTLLRLQAQTRGQDESQGVHTSHGFAYGHHPGPTSLGALVLHDQHTLQAGCGFAPHEHRELEIVTWVVSGRLEHLGEDGSLVPLGPGTVQHLTAGTGVRHAEHAGAGGAQVVQCWLLPDAAGRPPAYRSRQPLLTPALTEVLALREGSLLVARLDPGESVDVPQAPYVHAFVTYGSLTYADAERLRAGDALHLTGEGRVRLTASTPAEVIVWVLHGTSWHPDLDGQDHT